MVKLAALAGIFARCDPSLCDPPVVSPQAVLVPTLVVGRASPSALISFAVSNADKPASGYDISRGRSLISPDADQKTEPPKLDDTKWEM